MQDERRYRVETTAGTLERLPFAQAVKMKRWPVWCVSIWHAEPGAKVAQAGRSSNLCPECEELLRWAWRSIADHWPDLEDLLGVSLQARAGERVASSSEGSPMLIDPKVSEVMGLARSAIWSTIGDLIEDRPVRLPADHGAGVLADWLARNFVTYVASHPSSTHSSTVLTEAYDVAIEVRRTAFRAGKVQAEGGHKCWQATVSADGNRVRCQGDLVAVEMPNGSRSVECTADPEHRIPVDVFFQIKRARSPRPSRAKTTLMRKYGRHAATSPMPEGA